MITLKILITLICTVLLLGYTLTSVYREEELPDNPTAALGALAFLIPVAILAVIIELVWF